MRNVSTNYEFRNEDLSCSVNHTAINYLKEQEDYYTWGYYSVSGK